MARAYILCLLGSLFLATSCSSDLSSLPPLNLPGINTGTPGTPYGDLMDGRLPAEDSSFPDASEPDAASPEDDSGSVGEDAAQQVDDSGTETDAGSKSCPPDAFKSARTAADAKLNLVLSGDLSGDCDGAKHPLVLAKGQTVHVELWGDHLTPDLRIYGPGNRGYLMESVKYYPGVLAAIEFTADIPGEYFLLVNQTGRHGASPYKLSVDCKEMCGLTATRYPIIMVPGYFGFQNIGPIDYFWKVNETLTPEGYDLYFAPVDAFNSIEIRGGELAAFVDQVLAKTYAMKVNLIGHSQGGLDSRYIISGKGYAPVVGMLNMVASPHHGTQIADAIISDPTGIGAPLVNALGVIFGAVLSGPDAQQDMMASLNSLSTANMAKFNPLYPDSPLVAYRSWAGKTCYSWDNCGTAVDLLLIPTFEYLKGAAGDNDGIVPTQSAIWTGFQGILAADHFNEIGQLLGATGSFDHLKFYQNMVDSMKAAGY